MANGNGSNARRIVPFVVALFFIWGFATVLNDVLIPKLKGLFELSYTEVMLTQFCFFLGYLFFSIPAGFLLSRVGYVRGIIAGLLLMGLGYLLFVPAALIGAYPGFLAALFIVAGGITILQVAANPLIALLGKPEGAHSRLTLAQAFNSIGTTVGPRIGSALLLATGVAIPAVARFSPATLAAYRQKEAYALQWPFLAFACLLALLAVVFWSLRRAQLPTVEKAASVGATFALLKNPRLAFGMLSIFIYVGAEVSIGSLLTNYLMQPSVLAISAKDAADTLVYYWGGAMVGRFIGSVALRVVSAGRALTVCAIVACLLAATSAVSAGMVAAVTLLAVGLFNSIQFPTIFTLAIEGEAADTPEASALLCMSIVGGAVIPVITGAVADRIGLSLALFVPAFCYVWIAVYGWIGRNPATKLSAQRA
ncbi:MAG TPA: sugar MFS transporter [Rhizomicrobium sp.]|nr:sugar MFS transporter [Rhizomicrobium sp.]